MTQDFWVRIGGQVRGPISSREVKRLAVVGELRPADEVSKDGVGWTRASAVKGLAFSAGNEAASDTGVYEFAGEPESVAADSNHTSLVANESLPDVDYEVLDGGRRIQFSCPHCGHLTRVEIVFGGSTSSFGLSEW